jgi:biotin transport system substrate-specific component
VIRLQYVASPTLADALFPKIDSDNKARAWAREIALLVGFAAFVGLAAQIQIRVPWTTVPITGQTYAALVTGGALGFRRGAGALVLYAIAGMFLLPIFTPGSAATSGTWDMHFILPWSGTESVIWNLSNGGYIVGFALAAGVIGFMSERGIDRGPWVHLAMLAGNLLIYVPGLLWLGYLIATDWTAPGGSAPLSELIAGTDTLDKTLRGGLYPFIVGDLMKLLAAAATLPAAWWVVEKLGRGRE